MQARTALDTINLGHRPKIQLCAQESRIANRALAPSLALTAVILLVRPYAPPDNTLRGAPPTEVCVKRDLRDIGLLRSIEKFYKRFVRLVDSPRSKLSRPSLRMWAPSPARRKEDKTETMSLQALLTYERVLLGTKARRLMALICLLWVCRSE